MSPRRTGQRYGSPDDVESRLPPSGESPAVSVNRRCVRNLRIVRFGPLRRNRPSARKNRFTWNLKHDRTSCGALGVQRRRRFPVKRQLGSARRQLCCLAEPPLSRVADRGVPSLRRASSPEAAPETSRRTRAGLRAPPPCSLHVEPLCGYPAASAKPWGRCLRSLTANDSHAANVIERPPLSSLTACSHSPGACRQRETVRRETSLHAQGTTQRVPDVALGRCLAVQIREVSRRTSSRAVRRTG